MRPPRRHLAGLAVALILCVVATACDSSPYAASVNGQVIKETALNRQLAQITANRAFITGTVEAPAPNGEGVQVSGDANGSYSAAWSASVLTATITAEVVHQHLVKTDDLPQQFQLDMARAVASADFSQDLSWYRFSPEVRSTIVDRNAELAQVVPVAARITAAQLRTIYDSALQTSLFTGVCVRSVDVGVTNAGGVDFPASLAKARALVDAIDAGGVTGAANPSFGGAVSCYTHAAFEQQPLGFIGAVLATKPGQAAPPQRNQDGYQVIAVASRALVPYGPAFAHAISVVVQVSSINSAGSTVPALDALVAKADVKINPAYGSWNRTSNGWAVVAPSGPAAHPANVAGAV